MTKRVGLVSELSEDESEHFLNDLESGFGGFVEEKNSPSYLLNLGFAQVVWQLLVQSDEFKSYIKKKYHSIFESFCISDDIKRSDKVLTRFIENPIAKDETRKYFCLSLINREYDLVRDEFYSDDKRAKLETIIAQWRENSVDDNPAGSKRSQLISLLGMDENSISSPKDIAGEYFGYRRSSTRGHIIRFSVKIEASENGLYTFQNRFRRNDNFWVVSGTGFAKDENIYLIGNSKFENTGPGGSLRRGIRCFALRTATDGCLYGIVLTTQDADKPIAARIVLIPMDQHRVPGRRSEIWSKNNHPFPDGISYQPTYSHMLRSAEQDRRFWLGSVQSDDFLEECLFLLPRGENADYIRNSIRNGNVSTLLAEEFRDRDQVKRAEDSRNTEIFINSLMGGGANSEGGGVNSQFLYLRAINGFEDRAKAAKS